MTISYKSENRQDYIYFLGEGIEDGLEENKQIHQMIINTCKSHKCNHVLIDDREVTYTASIFSIYQLAKFYTTADIPRYIKRAAVVVNPKHNETNEFFENTTRNRGVDLRIFHRIEEAEAWLLKKQECNNNGI